MDSLRQEFAKELAEIKAQEQGLQTSVTDLDRRISLLERGAP